MSRGHGRIQRAILAHLHTDPERLGQTVASMVTAFGGSMDDRSEMESVRRACRRLRDEGLVGISWVGEHDWSRTFWVVYLDEWLDDDNWKLAFNPLTPGRIEKALSRLLAEPGGSERLAEAFAAAADRMERDEGQP